jgi:hypothetical protein
MPWWMNLYIIFFLIILVSNTYFHIKYKAKKKILLYEILSTLYLLFLIFTYWHPTLLNKLSVANIAVFLVIICVDFYFSIWGKIEDVGMKNIPAISNKDMENAKAVSLIIAAPAYITSFLVVLSLLQSHILILNF